MREGQESSLSRDRFATASSPSAPSSRRFRGADPSFSTALGLACTRAAIAGNCEPEKQQERTIGRRARWQRPSRLRPACDVSDQRSTRATRVPRVGTRRPGIGSALRPASDRPEPCAHRPPTPCALPTRPVTIVVKDVALPPISPDLTGSRDPIFRSHCIPNPLARSTTHRIVGEALVRGGELEKLGQPVVSLVRGFAVKLKLRQESHGACEDGGVRLLPGNLVLQGAASDFLALLRKRGSQLL